MVLVTRLTEPAPLQVLQVLKDDLSLAPEPSQDLQTTFLLTFIFFSTPFAISSSVNFTLMRRLLPRATLLPPPLEREPPKKLSKPPPPPPPKMSPNWLKISSISIPPAPPPNPPFAPACPNWSYR